MDDNQWWVYERREEIHDLIVGMGWHWDYVYRKDLFLSERLIRFQALA
jgi:hypothetical protein